MSARRRVARFPQASSWKHAPVRNLTGCRHQHVEISRQGEVLKPVVEHVDGGTELTLREHAGQVPVFGHADHGAGDRAGQHQRLITRA